MNADIALVLLDGNRTEKTPAKRLAEIRHNTEICDVIVDRIIKTISEKLKLAHRDCIYINHLRFIKEANVPKHLVKSVTDKVKLRIKSDFNGCYKPLSRAPKKIEEDYFLLK